MNSHGFYDDKVKVRLTVQIIDMKKTLKLVGMGHGCAGDCGWAGECCWDHNLENAIMLVIKYDVGDDFQGAVIRRFAKVIAKDGLEKYYGGNHDEGENGLKTRKG